MKENATETPALGCTSGRPRLSEKDELRINELAIDKAQRLISEASFLCGVSKELIGTSHELIDGSELADRAIRSRETPRASTWVKALRLIALERKDRALAIILDLAVDITDAEFGNIQAFDESSQTLKIVASRGFDSEFLDFFERVQVAESACGSAMQQKSRVIVSDVMHDPVFSRKSREVMLRSNVLACQSTPLFSSEGQFLGMLSTHYRKARRPPSRSLAYLDLLSSRAENLFPDTCERLLKARVSGQ